MTDSKLEGTSVAEAYLALLKARGIDWLFANAGTDFAPIIEALVRGAKAGLAMPEPVVVPHENAAVGMAHGYYLRHRPAAGGHGARQRRHGQRADGPAQCRARQRPDLLHLGAHAAHRERPARQPRPADPLGPGDVRPGRHAARVRQVGLRAALRRAGRDDRRPGARDRHEPSRAARSICSLPREALAAPLEGFAFGDTPAAGRAGAARARAGRDRARRRRSWPRRSAR